MGGKLLGWRTVCAVESAPFARRILLARQRDGHLDRFPIWDDVRTFDGHPWRGSVDVVSGGFPCQDISSAGRKEGITGARSGLWGEMARIVREVGPRFVFVENSPALTSRGLGVVLGDLASMGFDARWGVLGARHVGAPHKRDRIWVVACHPGRDREPAMPLHAEVAGVSGMVANAYGGARIERALGDLGCPDPSSTRRRGTVDLSREPRPKSWGGPSGVRERIVESRSTEGTRRETREEVLRRGSWWEHEPGVRRVADGVADRVDRLRALGNGQVPAVAALAWSLLTAGWND